MENIIWVVLLCAVLALLFAAWKTSAVSKADAGTERMKEIAGNISDGARAFLFAEYKILVIFVAVLFVLIGLFITWLTAVCFLIGAIFSVCAGYVGMNVATKANVRTAAAAKSSGMNKALGVAFSGGSVMGMCVVGLGLLGCAAIYAFTGNVEILTGFSLGASSIALFARVGGGIYTKAADVGADLVGKVEAGIPEDDPRNPAVIADNVGDNVGDVAGMGADLYERFPTFRAVLDSAAARVDFDLKEVSFTDAKGVLNQTRYTQPCMVAFAAGVTAVLKENGVKADDLAGLSLGEYSALEAAGVFTAKQAVELAAFRGKAMADAARGIECGMTAVMNLDRDALAKCCEEASALGCVQICNYNCPGQLVIGGEKAAVEKAAELAKAAGARRCIPLKVSGPFHTPLMAPAGDALAERFRTVEFREPQIPVIFNCLGAERPDGAAIPELLVRQVQSSVYMEDSLRRMAAMGLDALVEIGPGKALSGFVKKTVPELPVYAVETAAELEQLTETLKGASL